MKTENLSWIEAIKAYAEGKRIREKNGDEYWLDGDTPMFKTGYKYEPEVHMTADLYPDLAPFSIVVPEQKSLSAAEVMLLDRCVVHLPGFEPQEFRKVGGRWGSYQVVLIALAEAQGFKITEVTE